MTGSNTALGFKMGNDGEGAGEEGTVKMLGGRIEGNVLPSHLLIGNSDRDGLTFTAGFELEKFGNGRGIGGVGAQAVAGFGGVDNQAALF